MNYQRHICCVITLYSRRCWEIHVFDKKNEWKPICWVKTLWMISSYKAQRYINWVKIRRLTKEYTSAAARSIHSRPRALAFILSSGNWTKNSALSLSCFSRKSLEPVGQRWSAYQRTIRPRRRTESKNSREREREPVFYFYIAFSRLQRCLTRTLSLSLAVISF